MECRKNCGACCIVPSIKNPYINMPYGKRANERCINLNENYECVVYNERPQFCRNFKAEIDICGNSREEAIRNLLFIENYTKNNDS